MHREYGTKASYCCSKSAGSRKLKKICDINTLDGDTFEKRILFTTSVLDNGKSLKDKKIKHIFTELKDPDSLIQSLGRKRSIDVDDHCTFYIQEFSRNSYDTYIENNNKKIKLAQKFIDDEESIKSTVIMDECFFENYPHFYLGLDINGNFTVKLNNMLYLKFILNNITFKQIKEQGYIESITNILGKELKAKANIYDVYYEAKEQLCEKLMTLINVKLYAKHKDEIWELFNKAGCKIRYKTGIKSYNDALMKIFPNAKIHFINSIFGKRLRDYTVKSDTNYENSTSGEYYWLLVYTDTDNQSSSNL